MSIKVTVEELPGVLAELNGQPFLATTSATGGPKITHVPLSVAEDGSMRAPVGKGTANNIADRAEVTLLWPGSDDASMSLLVDAVASVEADADGSVAVFTATGAVWHRPAAAPTC